ncbi:MAG: ISL3 family transposase [bacterium]|nr:ISL3 family transposase [bacterium]
MHITTILKRVHKLKGFVYGPPELIALEGAPILEIPLRPRRGSRGIDSGCGTRAAGYDRLPERRYEFIPFWGILVFLVYAPRRVACPQCGIKVERLPWTEGKSPITTRYAWFLADWAKLLAWSVVAARFRTSWHTVAGAVEGAVAWGRERLDLSGITAIGVDEIAWRKGHVYATVVYQINEGRKRLPWVGEHRKAKTLLRFFHWLDRERSAAIAFVASDMWKAYLKVIAKKIPHAIHVLDRFHLMQHMNKAIDQVRAEEAKQMKRRGLEPLLAHSRWCLLRHDHYLTGRQREKLVSLLPYNLRTVKAYLMKEEFHQFWDYVSNWWAGVFLDAWCRRAMLSKIEPVKRVARMLRGHRELILNWFRAKKEFSSGAVEGLNNKAKLSTKMAYGYGAFKTLDTVLYHRLGDLHQPHFTHEFF